MIRLAVDNTVHPDLDYAHVFFRLEGKVLSDAVRALPISSSPSALQVQLRVPEKFSSVYETGVDLTQHMDVVSLTRDIWQDYVHPLVKNVLEQERDDNKTCRDILNGPNCQLQRDVAEAAGHYFGKYKSLLPREAASSMKGEEIIRTGTLSRLQRMLDKAIDQSVFETEDAAFWNRLVNGSRSYDLQGAGHIVPSEPVRVAVREIASSIVGDANSVLEGLARWTPVQLVAQREGWEAWEDLLERDTIFDSRSNYAQLKNISPRP